MWFAYFLAPALAGDECSPPVTVSPEEDRALEELRLGIAGELTQSKWIEEFEVHDTSACQPAHWLVIDGGQGRYRNVATTSIGHTGGYATSYLNSIAEVVAEQQQCCLQKGYDTRVEVRDIWTWPTYDPSPFAFPWPGTAVWAFGTLVCGNYVNTPPTD